MRSGPVPRAPQVRNRARSYTPHTHAQARTSAGVRYTLPVRESVISDAWLRAAAEARRVKLEVRTAVLAESCVCVRIAGGTEVRARVEFFFFSK